MSYEQAVLGTALADQTAMEEAGDLIPSDFIEPGHQVLWAEMMALYQRNGLEVRSLVEALGKSPDLPALTAELGPIEDYIAHLLNLRGTMMSEYSSQVLDASIKRGARKSAAMIAAMAADERASAGEVLEYAEKHILSLRRNRLNNGISMADLFGVYVPRLEGLREGTIKPAWTPNLVALREVVQFAEQTDLITIAARPGDGKSSFMRYELLKYALNGGKPLIFNLENDNMDYAMHFLALYVNSDSTRPVIENTKLKNPRLLSEVEMQRVREAAQTLARLPITIITMGAPTVAQVIQVARRKIAEQHCDLIGLDYVQLVRNGKDSRNDDIGETTGALRGLNLQMHIPILMNAQLNREIERRAEDAEPQLSDLRDSGSIEQDSTHVIFPRSAWKNPTVTQIRVFPENVDEHNRPYPRLKAVPLIFYVRKNRNGPTGLTTYVKWTKTTGNFQTLEREARL
jgi:replicative DNA helicase